MSCLMLNAHTFPFLEVYVFLQYISIFLYLPFTTFLVPVFIMGEKFKGRWNNLLDFRVNLCLAILVYNSYCTISGQKGWPFCFPLVNTVSMQICTTASGEEFLKSEAFFYYYYFFLWLLFLNIKILIIMISFFRLCSQVLNISSREWNYY